MSKPREIGTIGNYYGTLNIKEEEGKFYWGIDDYTGTGWQEIPEYLFKALNQFQDETK